jgi:hypothetical protein
VNSFVPALPPTSGVVLHGNTNIDAILEDAVDELSIPDPNTEPREKAAARTFHLSGTLVRVHAPKITQRLVY